MTATSCGSKCKVLSVTRKKAPISFPYHLGSKELLRVDDEKDLGIIFSSKLQWNLHINQMISKANRQLGVLKRTCYSLTDINIRRTLYISLVKSKLSYATQVWSPTHNRQLSERIERVQRRATKWILRTGSCEMPYKQRLLKLELLPLSYDREMKDLVFFFKSLYGYVDLNINNFVSFVQHGRTRLSQATGVMIQIKLPCAELLRFNFLISTVLSNRGTVYVKMSIQIHSLALSLSKTFLNADI